MYLYRFCKLYRFFICRVTKHLCQCGDDPSIEHRGFDLPADLIPLKYRSKFEDFKRLHKNINLLERSSDILLKFAVRNK